MKTTLDLVWTFSVAHTPMHFFRLSALQKSATCSLALRALYV